MKNNPTIALVYDRLNTKHGGAEYLLKLFCQAFPNAPVFTSVYHPKINWQAKNKIKVSFLQKLRLSHRHQWLTPLMPLAFESLDLAQFDIVISLTSAEAKGVLTKPNQLHLSYIFSPTKYLYEYHERYEKTGLKNSLKLLKPLIVLMRKYLTWWDQSAILRPDKIFTLSKISAQKIKQTYGLKSEVIYPPVRPISYDQTSGENLLPADFPPFLLSASRLVSYKRVELAIHTAIKRGQPLLIIGEGLAKADLTKLYPKKTHLRANQLTLFETLKTAQGKLIIFLGECDDKEYAILLQKTQAVLALGDEDFGLVGLEALSLGAPVVISKYSGVTELVGQQTGVGVFNPKFPNTLNKVINTLPKKSYLEPGLALKLQPMKFIQTWQSLVQREWRKLELL